MAPAAIAIACGYGLTILALLGRRRLRRPWLWAAFAAGALAFPVALLLIAPIQQLLASIAGWDMDAYSTGLRAGLAGSMVTASVNEVFTLAAALLALSQNRKGSDALAFGAASGAGFAVVGASEVIRLALITHALPIGSPFGLAASLTQQFAFVAVHAALTALAAVGVAEGRAGAALAAVILCEGLFHGLGLLFALRVFALLIWTLLSAAWGVLLLAVAFRLSLRPAPAGHPPAAS
jgi:hypothetical protein